MANFDQAFDVLMYLEGVHSDNPQDSGGDTYFGIARNYNPNMTPWPPTKAQAQQWYQTEYWDALGLDTVDYDVALHLFLAAVNQEGAGTNQGPAVSTLQLALAEVGQGLGTQERGVFGPLTHAAVAKAVAANKADFLARFRAALATYYVELVLKTPSKQVFLNGWLWRACW